MPHDQTADDNLHFQRLDHQARKAYCSQAQHVGRPDPHRSGSGEARDCLYQGMDTSLGPDATQLVHSP